MLKRLALLMSGAFLIVACASGRKSSRCAPVDPFLYEEYGGLYDECSVEKRAHVVFAPRIDYPYQVQTNVTCVFGELKVIVDTMGKPIPETVQVSRANDQRYLELMFQALPQVRFAPGSVKGRKVHQIARWESRTAVSSMRTNAPATPC